MVKMRWLNQDITYGKIYLHSMSGRYEKLDDFEKEIKKLNLYNIICLTNKTEIEEKSPDYLKSIDDGQLADIPIVYNSIPDFGIPTEVKDISKYESTLKESYETLKAGNILIHCAGGYGRTGTFATMLLKTAGFSFEEALEITIKAGSKPETQGQLGFCKKYKSKIKILKTKSCLNCNYGIPIPGHTYECGLRIDNEWVYKGGYCSKELICDHWVVDEYDGMEDKSERWKNAVTINVD